MSSVPCESSGYPGCGGYCFTGDCTNDPFGDGGAGSCYCHYGCDEANILNCGGGICTTIGEVCVVKGDRTGCECKSEALTTTMPSPSPSPSPSPIFCYEFTQAMGCGGICPTGSLCEPVALAGCGCKPLCENSGPTCGGICLSEGETCGPTLLGLGCECQADCAGSEESGCDGTCPVDKVCLVDEDYGGCYCEDLCEYSGIPNPNGPAIGCSGQCAEDNEVCAPNLDSMGCGCKKPCANEGSGTCASGYCEDEDERCRVTEGGSGCECVKIDCEDCEHPNCDGTCPEGELCKANEDWTGCECRGNCGDSEHPECGGACTGGQKCMASTLYNFCYCDTRCGASYPACTGVCEEEGDECYFNADGTGCDCEIPCADSDYAICDGGCPWGWNCIAGASFSCICQPPCEIHDAGSCPGGFCQNPLEDCIEVVGPAGYSICSCEEAYGIV